MNTKSFFYLFAFLGSFLLISSCVKNDFDEPPADGEDPALTANATIADIKGIHSTGGFETIEEDWIVKGIVVADDESGNFYKTIVIEDETGGINILINATGLYNEFTIGRRVFIKCKGLVVSDYNGLIQVGGSSYIQDDGSERLSGIEEVLLNEFVFPGVRNQPVTPTEYTIGQLSPAVNSTLIQLNNVEFRASDRGVTYADGVNNISTNLILVDCNGSSVLVRTSGYCNFANDLTPTGNGTFVGIMSSFGDDKQLLIRNSYDLTMTGELCDGSTGGGPGGACEGEGDGAIDENFSNQFDQEDISFPGWCNIATEGERLWIAREFGGNVYASASAYNDSSPSGVAWLITEKFDVSAKPFLNFESAQNNWTHDGLTVWIASDFEGDPLAANWTQLSCTLAQESDSWYEFIPSGDIDLSAYSGNVNIAFRYEGTSAALTGSFHLDNVLVSEEGLGNGGGGGGGGNGGVCEGEGDGQINEDFSSQSANDDINFPGWCNIATTGNRLWIGKEFDGNTYAQASAYNDADPLMSAWLITETFDATTPKTLNFDCATAFYTHDGLTVWISSDYTGDPLAANWTQLSCNLPGSGQANYEYVASGDIDLSSFSGNVNVAFRYDGGSSTGETATFQLDNIVISE